MVSNNPHGTEKRKQKGRTMKAALGIEKIMINPLSP
jgi:hypothetical protein